MNKIRTSYDEINSESRTDEIRRGTETVSHAEFRVANEKTVEREFVPKEETAPPSQPKKRTASSENKKNDSERVAAFSKYLSMIAATVATAVVIGVSVLLGLTVILGQEIIGLTSFTVQFEIENRGETELFASLTDEDETEVAASALEPQDGQYELSFDGLSSSSDYTLQIYGSDGKVYWTHGVRTDDAIIFGEESGGFVPLYLHEELTESMFADNTLSLYDSEEKDFSSNIIYGEGGEYKLFTGGLYSDTYTFTLRSFLEDTEFFSSQEKQLGDLEKPEFNISVNRMNITAQHLSGDIDFYSSFEIELVSDEKYYSFPCDDSYIDSETNFPTDGYISIGNENNYLGSGFTSAAGRTLIANLLETIQSGTYEISVYGIYESGEEVYLSNQIYRSEATVGEASSAEPIKKFLSFGDTREDGAVDLYITEDYLSSSSFFSINLTDSEGKDFTSSIIYVDANGDRSTVNYRELSTSNFNLLLYTGGLYTDTYTFTLSTSEGDFIQEEVLGALVKPEYVFSASDSTIRLDLTSGDVSFYNKFEFEISDGTVENTVYFSTTDITLEGNNILATVTTSDIISGNYILTVYGLNDLQDATIRNQIYSGDITVSETIPAYTDQVSEVITLSEAADSRFVQINIREDIAAYTTTGLVLTDSLGNDFSSSIIYVLEDGIAYTVDNIAALADRPISEIQMLIYDEGLIQDAYLIKLSTPDGDFVQEEELGRLVPPKYSFAYENGMITLNNTAGDVSIYNEFEVELIDEEGNTYSFGSADITLDGSNITVIPSEGVFGGGAYTLKIYGQLSLTYSSQELPIRNEIYSSPVTIQ